LLSGYLPHRRRKVRRKTGNSLWRDRRASDRACYKLKSRSALPCAKRPADHSQLVVTATIQRIRALVLQRQAVSANRSTTLQKFLYFVPACPGLGDNLHIQGSLRLNNSLGSACGRAYSHRIPVVKKYISSRGWKELAVRWRRSAVTIRPYQKDSRSSRTRVRQLFGAGGMMA
jgi:hypothetical protein